jgi:hypothetical protein
MLLGVMTTFAWAQTAQSTMIEFNKTKVPGIVVAVTEFDAATVTAALQARLETMGGLKGSNVKGFRSYPGQIFTDFGDIRYDIFTRVVPGNKKDKKVLIQLMVSLGSENFVSQTANPILNHMMIDFLSNFAENFLPDFDRNRKVQANNKDLEKLEKERTKLVSNRDKLRNNLEKQERALTAKEAEIAQIRQALGNLKQ